MAILTEFRDNVLCGFLQKGRREPSDLRVSVFQDGERIPSAMSFDAPNETGWPFRIFLPSTVKPGDGPALAVKWADSDKFLDTHPDLSGFVNDHNEFGSSQNIHLTEHPLFFRAVEFSLPLFTVPQHMIDYVAGTGTQETFRRLGFNTALDVVRFGVISSPADKVFELGCGCGRLSLVVSSMLAPAQGGAFTGFDIWREGVEWATNNITSLRPHAKFRALGLHDGYDAKAAYRIDLPDNSHDAFIATSVFTHLRYHAANAYAAEIARILKPGGKGYITFFASKEIWRSFGMGVEPEEDEYGINYVNVQAEDTFVDESHAVDMLESHGLKVLGVKYGTWRGSKYSYRGTPGFQDVFIVKKLA